MLLYLLSQPVELEGHWWAALPLKRDTLILPDDSVPQEKDAKIVIKAYQRFYFAYPKHRSHSGATLSAGYIAVKTSEKERIEKYRAKGYKLLRRERMDTISYELYYYPIPRVDSLIVYVRSKEKYCSLIMSTDIRMVDDTGGVIEGQGWKVVKVVVKEPNRWHRGTIYLPGILGPITSLSVVHTYGLTFSIGPDRGSIDSCAAFEVGPIYLK